MNAQFPNYQWAHNLTTNYVMSSAEDSNGNVYVVGRFAGTIDFDPGPGTTTVTSIGQWGYIAKFSSTGSFIWVKTISHSNTSGQVWIRKIKTDSNNNIYVVGDLYTSGVDFDPGAGTANLPCPTAGLSNSDAFVAKYDANGNYQWAQTIYNTSAANTTEIAIDIVIDETNNKVRVSSQTTTTSGGNTIRYATDAPCFFSVPGNLSFITYGAVLTYSASNGAGIAPGNESSLNYGNQPPYLDIDNLGNYYTAGWYSSTPQTLQLIKTSPTGTVVWSRSISNGSSNNIQPADIALDPSNNVYVYGRFSGTMDFDASASNTLVTSNTNSYDAFLLEYSNSGNYMWVGTFGSNQPETPKSMDIFKGSGNIYLTGDFTGSIDVDFNASVATLTASAVITNLVKYDVNRNHIWSTTMPNATTIWEIYTSKLDNLFLTGFNVGSLDMNFSPSTNNISTGGFISKYNNCSSAPTLPGTIAGLSTMCAGSGATSYSIATVSSATSYSWNLPGGWSGTSSTNTISATPGASGVFSVTANNACGASPQQTLAVTVNPLPTVSVNSGSICIGQSFTLSPSGAATYTIQGGNAVVSPTSSSTYSVIGTSTAGCISSAPASSSVTVNPLPAINASTSNTLICAGQTATLTASGAFTYTWNPGGAGTSIAVSPSLTTTYTISGTSSAGCNNVSTITQSVSACTSINETAIPVMIRIYPNPAHSNFFIETDIKNFNLKLYDAYGKLIVEKVYADANTVEINLQEMNAGIYFVELEAEGGRSYFKLVKE